MGAVLAPTRLLPSPLGRLAVDGDPTNTTTSGLRLFCVSEGEHQSTRCAACVVCSTNEPLLAEYIEIRS